MDTYDSALDGSEDKGIELLRLMRRRKYWYEIWIDECVLCGRGHDSITRERRYTPKPDSYQERVHYTQINCSGHFL